MIPAPPPVKSQSTSSSSTQDSTWSCPLEPTDTFLRRHVGPSAAEVAEMVSFLGFKELDEMIDIAIPKKIRFKKKLKLPAPLGEHAVLERLKGIVGKNKIYRSYIGMGYHDCITPPVVQRNILENPGWYTAYTPYQAEISQGRMEALLNFQTMIIDLTGMEIANASLLDEATAAAEAMHLCKQVSEKEDANIFFISNTVHPQTIDVVRTRAVPIGITVEVGDHRTYKPTDKLLGALVQYPASEGQILDYTDFFAAVHAAGGLAIAAADLLSLVLLRAPGEFGADVVLGNSQRFGVPLGFGGPHAAFFATHDKYKRAMPGRLIGVSKDAQGKPAMRLSLQTREQHIRREKATSNICTAQVLLSVMASMYAVYHGPEGLKQIASRVHALTATLAAGLKKLGVKIPSDLYFDTLRVETDDSAKIIALAEKKKINLRRIDEKTVGITLNEATESSDLYDLFAVFNNGVAVDWKISEWIRETPLDLSQAVLRKQPILTHPVFNQYHTETEMLRYIRRLEAKDLSLTTSMIPLGSCTMKLNATTEMFPVTWPEVGRIHPFVPEDQIKGYQVLFAELEKWLNEITGMAGTSLQPNSGSAGEYAGLLAIRGYLQANGQGKRNTCLIPVSAHGTNPASAAMAGFNIVPVACDSKGNIDVTDLKAKADEHAADLACIMITYPSTHGVFEETILDAVKIVHSHGGQVYMDGANMNAQVGLCRPGDYGIDVCHLNLHKTFCIPHGGGGPGVGPICVAKHLIPYLPGHPVTAPGNDKKSDAISAAPWGSASILVISWAYIAMLGAEGLTHATKIAILNANYVARQLESYIPSLYKGHGDLVAHECILDFRGWKNRAGIEVEDVAKRLMDYGFHAPTMSWPVAGTLMVEPTESESKAELDRFCAAMTSIYKEMQAVEEGKMDKTNNPLKNAPHAADVILSDSWNRPYSREQAAYPAPWTRNHKYWPPVSRVDNVYGDRNLVCSCLPMEDYQGEK